MRFPKRAAVALFLFVGGIVASTAAPVRAQALIDRGFVHGWNLMVDPSFGNGCLIQTVYQDLSVVRLGYDATNNRGYFAVFNKAWGDIEKGRQYAIVFDLDGKRFDATATGLKQDRVPGAVVFFSDRNFVHAIAEKKGMTVYGQTGQTVMKIDLTGTAKALEYARKCQQEMGWGG
ncbi:hypothetical protein LCL97_12785 [Seohaeicola saemankumensis]|nr:hypothetical protein [Seohaeicola saemankumensis]MCA0871706.1 hypothetical protein [Seohaeicola saemankumensis]